MHVGIMLLHFLNVKDGGGQFSSATSVSSAFLNIYATFDKIMVKYNFHNTALKMLTLKYSCGKSNNE